MSDKLYLGIDGGGTKTAFALMEFIQKNKK